MLTIRDEQLKAFLCSRSRNSVDPLVERLIRKYPQQCATMGGEPGTRAFAERTVATASDWGISSEEALTVLADLLVQFGEGFERSPFQQWSLTILQNPIMTGDLKVDTVWDRHSSLTGGRQMIFA